MKCRFLALGFEFYFALSAGVSHGATCNAPCPRDIVLKLNSYNDRKIEPFVVHGNIHYVRNVKLFAGVLEHLGEMRIDINILPIAKGL